MSAVNITSVNVLDNPAPFLNPLQFEIHYECLADLAEDLQWKLVYVGSAESEKFDQVLDDVEVGPVKRGKYKFVLQADAPKSDKIPKVDVVGVTVILLTCSYRNSEFLRVGYYCSIEYADEGLRENPPDNPDFSKLIRRIMEENPRVTRFQNRFDDPEENAADQDGPVEHADDDLVVGTDIHDAADDGMEEDVSNGNRDDYDKSLKDEEEL
eukprot:jgi/Ulvmu1/12483/UM009_0136.1